MIISEQLEIQTLGGLAIKRGDAAVDGLVSRKAEALLVYLACTGRPQPRSVLADLLWDNGSDSQVMNNLRVLLSSLRRKVGPFVNITRDTVVFCKDSHHWLDVSILEEGLAATHLQPDNPNPEKVTRAAETLALYQGDFLHGFYLRGSRGFEEWVVLERERLRLRVLETFQQLVAASLSLGQHVAGLEYVGRLLQLDPLHEVAHRQKMFLLAVSGQRHAALAHYDYFRQLMADELGATPNVETTTFYQQLQAGQLDLNNWRRVADISPLTIPLAPLPACPYRGLSPFGEADRPFFFGREAFTNRLVEAIWRQPVVAVVGPSGSGKSSVVMAGLLPQLRQESAPSSLFLSHTRQYSLSSIEKKGWLMATFRPASYPCRALAGAFMPLLEPNLSETERLTQTGKLAKRFCQGDVHPSDIIECILSKNPDKSHFLLVVDQFEEFYTQCPQEEACQHFLTILFQPLLTPSANGSNQPTITEEAGHIRLLLTLRADFLTPALAYKPLADALQNSMFIMGSMTRHELGLAVSQPAEKQGVTFEPGLVERILDDVGHRPGQLPLLEFALTTLWEQQNETYGQLTHTAYENIGRVEGALAQYADKVYTHLSKAEQDQARRVLVQLVRPGQQAEDARRQATRAELGEANWVLVQKLSHARLVVTGQNPAGDETVELIHETLISEWSRFAAWLKEDRAFRLWQEHLRVLTRQWETSDRDEGALLRGALLAQAQTWSRIREIDLSSNELAFVQASKTLQIEEQMAVQARYQHELTQAQARAASQTRASRKLRWLVFGLTLMFVVALCGVLVSMYQGQQARKLAQLALGRQLAAQAQSILLDQPDLALLLSVEANRLAEITGDRTGLPIDLVLNPYLNRFLAGHTDAVNHVTISPNGRLMASAGNDNTIILWDLATGQPVGSPLVAHTGGVNQVAFSPNGTLLASGGADNTIILWHVDSQKPRGLPLAAHQDEIVSVAFSPNGQRLLSASRDNTVILWDMLQGQPVYQFSTGHTDGTKQVAFSSNGKLLASVGGDTTISLWNAENGQPVGKPLKGEHTGAVHRVAFSPNGQMLASAGADHTIVLWDIETGQPLAPPLTGHNAAVNALAFNPTGTVLASGGADHAIILWDVASRQPLDSPLIAQHADVSGLAFSPDGQTLVSSSTAPRLVLWDMAAVQHFTNYNTAVNHVAFSPDGTRLASVSDDGSLEVWDVKTSQLIPGLDRDEVLQMAFSSNGEILAIQNLEGASTLQNIETGRQRLLASQIDPTRSVAISPNGQLLALAGGEDNQIMLWDLATGRLKAPPLNVNGHSDAVNRIAFSPNGQILASVGADQTIILWDVATGQPLGHPLIGHSGQIQALAFSPDSRLLASTSDDDTITLWQVATGQPYDQPLTGHTGHVQDIAFSPDGQLLASAGRDKVIILWDVPSLKPYSFPLTGHQDWVQSIAFSPNGHLLASGSQDGDILLWRIQTEPWPVRACAIANRNLTQAEWGQFMGADIPYQSTCSNLPAN